MSAVRARDRRGTLRSVENDGGHSGVGASQSWSIQHFSQANSVGEGQGDVPALLRRVADSFEKLGEVDIVMHDEITADGDWFSMSGTRRWYSI